VVHKKTQKKVVEISCLVSHPPFLLRKWLYSHLTVTAPIYGQEVGEATLYPRGKFENG